MILQYKGFNNNWCYEEAETISFANVYVGDVVRKYSRDGEAYKEIERKIKEKYPDGVDRDGLTLAFAQEEHEAVNNIIIQETNCGDDIIYHINGKFSDMQNVCVVMMKDKNKYVGTRVFAEGVYLLNNHGQTVQRLA